jgi:HAD superfamily hydrolase (TIGR01490 family)
MVAQNSDIAAFIDMDFTLYKKFLYQALFAHHKRNSFNRRSVYFFMAYHFPLWMLVKARLLSRDFFYRHNATNLAWLVKGVSLERADRIWDWVLENEIIPHLRPEMMAVIEDHKRQGHRIILNSGSFTPILDKVVAYLDVELAIATPLVVKNGRYTGKIVPPINVGEGKVERLKKFLESEGSRIDLGKSYFYTDSVVDASVMALFGNPIAVYPDSQLEELAIERGWKVISSA